MVETTILLAASRTNQTTVLRDAAVTYKVNTDAIALKVKQEFATKENAIKANAEMTKPSKKAAA
jgi:ParB family transcriptional regulator, chromosome partitioning protein